MKIAPSDDNVYHIFTFYFANHSGSHKQNFSDIFFFKHLLSFVNINTNKLCLESIAQLSIK